MRHSSRRPDSLDPDGGRPQATNDTLTLRIISGLALSAAALVLTYLGPLTFAVLTTGFVAVMAWEWNRLVCAKDIDAAWFLQVTITALASGLAATGWPLYALAAVIGGTCAVFTLRLVSFGPSLSWWSATGVYYAGLPAIALVWIRADPGYGWHAILFIFIAVWTTDTAAYIFGRMIGGPLLAPVISPKKTWAGFAGGILSAAAAGSAVLVGIAGAQSWASVIALSVAVSLVTQVGDLGESWVKRVFGRKDTSSIIPGHGGVLDRVDGLVLAALTCAALALVRMPEMPGYALVVWR